MSNIGNKETFSKNLKYYMEKKDVTQKEMAEIVGVATSTFNDWMKAKKYPRIDKVEMLANYFGILKSDLIEEKMTEEKSKKTMPFLTSSLDCELMVTFLMWLKQLKA